MRLLLSQVLTETADVSNNRRVRIRTVIESEPSEVLMCMCESTLKDKNAEAVPSRHIFSSAGASANFCAGQHNSSHLRFTWKFDQGFRWTESNILGWYTPRNVKKHLAIGVCPKCVDSVRNEWQQTHPECYNKKRRNTIWMKRRAIKNANEEDEVVGDPPVKRRGRMRRQDKRFDFIF